MPRLYRDGNTAVAIPAVGALDEACAIVSDGAVDRHIGRQLRRRRKLMGMPQHQLAAVLGVRFQQIQKYESGANRLSATRLWRLTRVLDVSMDYFFDGLNGLAGR